MGEEYAGKFSQIDIGDGEVVNVMKSILDDLQSTNTSVVKFGHILADAADNTNYRFLFSLSDCIAGIAENTKKLCETLSDSIVATTRMVEQTTELDGIPTSFDQD